MRTLTDNQKGFFLEYFFKSDSIAGWRNIATSLLEKGYAVVAGDKCVWTGGIGNFIKISPEKEYYECVRYEFDLEQFMSSDWFKDVYKQHLLKLHSEVYKTNERYEQLLKLNP